MSILTDAKELLLASEVEQMRGRQMGKTAEEAGAARPRPAQPEPVGAGAAEAPVGTWDGVASERPASRRSESVSLCRGRRVSRPVLRHADCVCSRDTSVNLGPSARCLGLVSWQKWESTLESSKKSPIQMTSLSKGVVYLGHLGLLGFFSPQKWLDFA